MLAENRVNQIEGQRQKNNAVKRGEPRKVEEAGGGRVELKVAAGWMRRRDKNELGGEKRHGPGKALQKKKAREKRPETPPKQQTSVP
jgi:hypothetical protein